MMYCEETDRESSHAICVSMAVWAACPVYVCVMQYGTTVMWYCCAVILAYSIVLLYGCITMIYCHSIILS